ncbi:hypothetical protein FRC10_007342 [Ceratobasidium sp. 414]|nr:hypothetical protein FRC10_007342 [Ceratobasidium sp. 414]
MPTGPTQADVLVAQALARVANAIQAAIFLAAMLLYNPSLQRIIIVPNPAPALLPGCLVRIPANSWRPFVFPLVYETAILCITFIKALTSRSRTPILMRLFRDGTLYYVTVVAVLLVTTIGATSQTVNTQPYLQDSQLELITEAQMRPIVIGSGYHIAGVGIGCSRLFLSLHAWSEAQNRNRRPSSSTNIRHSSALARKSSYSQPPTSAITETYEYELKARKPSDVESGTTSIHARTWSSDTVPPPVPPKDIDFQSMLPDIERPSLPERMWSTLPSAHNRQQQHQHYSRPPRSSSLYASGQVPDKLLLNTPTVPVVQEFDASERKVS